MNILECAALFLLLSSYFVTSCEEGEGEERPTFWGIPHVGKAFYLFLMYQTTRELKEIHAELYCFIQTRSHFFSFWPSSRSQILFLLANSLGVGPRYTRQRGKEAFPSEILSDQLSYSSSCVCNDWMKPGRPVFFISFLPTQMRNLDVNQLELRGCFGIFDFFSPVIFRFFYCFSPPTIELITKGSSSSHGNRIPTKLPRRKTKNCKARDLLLLTPISPSLLSPSRL